MERFIRVSSYAKEKEVSRQYIYQLLGTGLYSDAVKDIDGVIFVKPEVFDKLLKKCQK